MTDKQTEQLNELGLHNEPEEIESSSPITIGQGEENIGFKEAVKIANPNGLSIELYSSCLSVDQLANLLLQLNGQLIKPDKKTNGGSYLG